MSDELPVSTPLEQSPFGINSVVDFENRVNGYMATLYSGVDDVLVKYEELCNDKGINLIDLLFAASSIGGSVGSPNLSDAKYASGMVHYNGIRTSLLTAFDNPWARSQLIQSIESAKTLGLLKSKMLDKQAFFAEIRTAYNVFQASIKLYKGDRSSVSRDMYKSLGPRFVESYKELMDSRLGNENINFWGYQLMQGLISEYIKELNTLTKR